MAPFPLVLKYCPFNPIISLYNTTPIQFHLYGRTTKRLLATTDVLSAVVTEDSLGVLQWDQLCHSVASFAGTSIAAQATKEQLWELDKTYEDSLRLLRETNAAVEMNKYGAMMDFTAINVSLVKTGLQCAQRGFPVSATEAVALVNLLQFAEALQSNVKAAIKEDSDWFNKFMPLSELIMELMISRSLIKLIDQLVDEDGSVRDSASSNLRQAREQVRFLERKLYQLMESMIRNESKETSTMEISNVDGRWCIQSGGDTRPTFDGLLLSSGAGNLVEPLPAVPLNDELQRARASVAKAEADVLLKITKKIQEDFDDIEDLFNILIQIDTINARARYSISFEGSCPDLYLPQGYDSTLNTEIMPEGRVSETSQLTQKKWALYLPKSYHPLLLQQYRSNLQMAMKDLSNANAEIRRRKQLGGTGKWKDEANLNIPSLEMQVARLKQARPTPFDIFIEVQTKVLVVTGPNTGGKTIFLKTVGLAAMMAKSGLYVLASEPARIPWFDFVLADIGDEQSLSQSLSTFSGHLKQISDIKSLSTNLSLVLLDEVGAGTNPLEGAALGMSLLESFADAGSLLTVATTHHGELKTLKYSNAGFENACMEFDEVNLKPTYRILWGVPGRSNAINVAERLGLPSEIVGNARELYGAASTEINEVIVDMERFKHEYHEKIHEARHYLRRSKDLHRKLTLARKRIMEHRIKQRNRMVQEVSEAAVSARSIIHKKFRQQRSLPAQTTLQRVKVDNYTHRLTSDHYSETVKKNESSPAAEIAKSPDSTELLRTGELNFNRNESSPAAEITKSPDSTELLRTEKLELPKVGDMVNVPSLKMKATVLKLDPVKEEIIVQSGFMKLKLKLGDLVN